MDIRLNKLWYIHAMKYYSAKKKANYVYTHQLEWIFMLNENSQPQKSTFCIVPFIQHSCNNKGEQINNGLS